MPSSLIIIGKGGAAGSVPHAESACAMSWRLLLPVTVSRRTGSAAWVPGEVAFTSAISSVRRKHGDGIVREAIQAMADAFPGERLVAGSSVFTAICRILITPPADFDKDRLFKALLTFDMKGWAEFLAKSKGGDERAQRLREALLMAYQDAGRIAA